RASEVHRVHAGDLVARAVLARRERVADREAAHARLGEARERVRDLWVVRVHRDAEVAPVTGRVAIDVKRVWRLDVEAVACAWPGGALIVLRRESGACRVDQDPAAVQLDAAVR